MAIQEVQDILMGYVWSAVEMAPKIVMASVVVGVFWWLSRLAPSLTQSLLRRVTPDASLLRLAAIVTRVLVFAVGLLTAATLLFPGLGVGDLVGVLGLTSVAVGFAFKDIFQNFLAGIIILAQRPFHIGDQIRAGNLEGKVKDIQIRFTALQTYDGQLIIVPNSELYTNPVTVRTAHETRRSTFETGIGYGEDIEQAREVMHEALEGCQALEASPAPVVQVVGHGDSAILFEILYWTHSDMAHVRKARDEVATKIKVALDKASIEIPFPQRSLHLVQGASIEVQTQTQAQ